MAEQSDQQERLERVGEQEAFFVPPPGIHQWHPPSGYDGRTVDARYADLVCTMRALGEAYTVANPPGEVIAEATARAAELVELLRPYAVPEPDQLAGLRLDLPGRALLLVPPFVVDEYDSTSVRAHFTFGRYWVGGNMVAHGGAVSLMFDEILGRLANIEGRVPARTAYLRVTFRGPTPVEQELTFIGRLEREDGRKRFVHGEIHAGDRLCAEAEALFIALEPGQR